MLSIFERIHTISLFRFFDVVSVLFGLALVFGGCGFKGDPYFSTPSQAIDFKDLDNIDTRVE